MLEGKIIDGKRYYGNSFISDGVPEDTTKCITEVSDNGRWPSYHQCNKKRGHGKDGQYCKIHDPEFIKSKRQAEQDKWDRESEARKSKWDFNQSALSQCQNINPENPQAVASAIGDMHNALKEALVFFVEYDIENNVISGLSLRLREVLAKVDNGKEDK